MLSHLAALKGIAVSEAIHAHVFDEFVTCLWVRDMFMSSWHTGVYIASDELSHTRVTSRISEHTIALLPMSSWHMYELVAYVWVRDICMSSWYMYEFVTYVWVREICMSSWHKWAYIASDIYSRNRCDNNAEIDLDKGPQEKKSDTLAVSCANWQISSKVSSTVMPGSKTD